MAIRRKGPSGGLVTTRLPVPTINSVGRNAANKRAPYEAENLDNCFVSLERNLEKRPGFEVVPQFTIPDKTDWDFTDFDTRVDLYRLSGVGLPEGEDPTIAEKDFWYYWHSINEDNRYLIAIDFKARTNEKELYYVFQVLPNGTWKDVTPANQIGEASVVPAATREYITFGSDASDLGVVKTAVESLQAVSVGTNVLILNKNVYAGFSSDEDGVLFNLRGEKTTTEDIAGRPVKYYSAAEVVPVIAPGNDNIAFTADDITLGYRPLSAVQNDVLKSVTTHSTNPLIIDAVLGDQAVSQAAAYNGYRLTVTGGSGLGGYGVVNEYFGATKTARTSWIGPVPQISGTVSAAPYQADAVTFDPIPGTYTAYQLVLPSSANTTNGYYNSRTLQRQTGSTTWETVGTINTYDSVTKITNVKNWTNAAPAVGQTFRVVLPGQFLSSQPTYFVFVLSNVPVPLNPERNAPYTLLPLTYGIPLATTAAQTLNATVVTDPTNVKRLILTSNNHKLLAGQPVYLDFITGYTNATVDTASGNNKRLVFSTNDHGLKVKDKVFIDFVSGTSLADDTYTVDTVPNANSFTILINSNNTAITGGTAVIRKTSKDGVYTVDSIIDDNSFVVIYPENKTSIASGTVQVKQAVDNYYKDYKLEIQFVSNPGSGKVAKYTSSTNTAFVTNWQGDAPLNGNTYNVSLTDCTYTLAFVIYNGVETVSITTAGTTGVNGKYDDVQLIYDSGTTATTYPKAYIEVNNNEVTKCEIVSNARGTGFSFPSFTSNPTILKTTRTEIPAAFRCTVTSLTVEQEAKFIPVEDYVYFQKSLGYLGQKLNDPSEIQLPPSIDDWYDNNRNTRAPVDITASEMLKVLYDTRHPYGNYTSADGKLTNVNLVQGRGKVYYCANPFLSLTSGYYRVMSWAENAGSQWVQLASTSNFPDIEKQQPTNAAQEWVEIKPAGRPYLQKIRTPDKWSLIDGNRMPQKISLTVGATDNQWSIGPVRWTPRESGNNDNNPGPSVFRTTNRASLKHTQIISIAVFKDRLWFAADDVAFSSRIGRYEDLFIDDPINIVATDPIDIRASSNAFAQITHMVPFEDYIFINTKANTQFQLTAGSRDENDIVLTPFNVMLSPATYYSAASFVDPQTIGSQLYFFDRRKLYLFTGKNNLGLNSAVEVSATANDYLPENYGYACVGHAQNSLFVTDADNPNHIYIYTIRFSGDRVIQNSFYRYILDDESAVYSMQVYDKYLYVIIHKNDRVLIERTLLKDEHPIIPRLDHMFKVRISTQGPNPNTTYNPGLHETTYRLPTANYSLNDTFRVVIAPPAIQNQEDIAGVAFPPLVSIEEDGAYLNVVVLGRFDTEGANVYIGNPYKMEIEMSPLFVRDQDGNIIDGTLNLRTVVIRHFNTGNYDIVVSHRGRSPIVSSFTAIRPDFTIQEDALPLEAWAQNGEFVGKVFGFSESTNIKIVSDYITPVNISAIEFKGKFKQKYSAIN